MAKENYWVNADGLRVPFGARDTYNSEGASIRTVGRRKHLELRYNATDYADVATGVLHGNEAVIPAGSKIVSCEMTTLTQFTATTAINLSVGLKDNVDGSTVDADGLIVATAFPADDVVTVGAGADVGTITASDVVVSVDPNVADLLTGEAIITVIFEDAVPSSTPPGVITGEI
jgi:hypothetical protein